MKYLFSVVVLMLVTLKSSSQCSFKDYEKYVDERCPNCNISQEDSVVRKHIFLSDSKLTKIHNSFYYKLKKEYNGTAKEKKELEIKYERIYENLKKSRSEVLLFYRYLGKDGNDESNELMAYWFYTDKMVAILSDVQENLFGDD